MGREELDALCTAHGLLTVGEIMAGVPMDQWLANAQVTSPATFKRWVLSKRIQLLEMRARHDTGVHVLGEDADDFILGQLKVITEVHLNMKKAGMFGPADTDEEGHY